MHLDPRPAALVLLSGLVVSGCNPAPSEIEARRGFPSAAPSHASTRDPVGREPSRPSERKRYIPVGEALETIQAHVDVPVVLPRDPGAGLAHFRGWMADSKYLDWTVTRGIRSAGVTLRKDEQILILSFGLAGFDGCGDRTHAVETTVLGQPALVSQAPEHLWSTILWPVTNTGSTGRYGISGTFEAWRIVRLAESMERERLQAVEHPRAC